jgi:hypothetical protein
MSLISVTIIKGGQVKDAKIITISGMEKAFHQAHLYKANRLLFIYLDGKSMNVTLPIGDEEIQGKIAAISSEFKFADMINKTRKSHE